MGIEGLRERQQRLLVVGLAINALGTATLALIPGLWRLLNVAVLLVGCVLLGMAIGLQRQIAAAAANQRADGDVSSSASTAPAPHDPRA